MANGGRGHDWRVQRRRIAAIDRIVRIHKLSWLGIPNPLSVVTLGVQYLPEPSTLYYWVYWIRQVPRMIARGRTWAPSLDRSGSGRRATGRAMGMCVDIGGLANDIRPSLRQCMECRA